MSAVEAFAIANLLAAISLAILTYRLASRLRQSEERLAEQLAELRSAMNDRVVPSLAQLRDAFAMSAQTTSSSRKPADWSNLSTTDLLEQMREAKRLGDADEVLDLREQLSPRLDEARRDRMDRELAEWFTKQFQTALRSGKAALIAPAMGRAVEMFGDRPEMKHLSEALPTIRQSVGLCSKCGKPYRGTQAECPRCAGQQQSTEGVEEESNEDD